MTLSLVPALILFVVFTSPAGAKDAVAAVDRFSAALSSGALAKSGKELDPNVLFLESESELHMQKDGKPVTELSTETMLLQRRAAGWKIVHVHGSSRQKDPSAAH